MNHTALYPGSFDPPTLGHLNIIERTTHLFDDVVVGVLVNPSKSPLFTPEERVAMMHEACAHLPKVRVVQFQGLLVDFAQEQGATAVIRGLRAVSDFEYEFQMAMMNRRLNAHIETVFLMTEAEVFHISSRFVREVAALGGDVHHAVPPNVLIELNKRFAKKAKEQ